MSSIDDLCFDNDFTSELIKALPATEAMVTMNDVQLSNLECTKRCSKSTVLQEYYKDYKCGEDSASAEKKTLRSDSCAFAYSLTMPAKLLTTVSIGLTQNAKAISTLTIADLSLTDATISDTLLYRSIQCSTFDLNNPNCIYREKLDDLFARSNEWAVDAPSGFDGEASTLWRYKVDDGKWAAWTDSAQVEISNAFSSIFVEAWTPCGRVLKVTKFDVNLYFLDELPPTLAALEAWSLGDARQLLPLGLVAVAMAILVVLAAVARRAKAKASPKVEGDAYYPLLD